jgi:hypothetical protein
MKTDILGNRIYRYLLGDLPEKEQSALEQEFLADGETFEQVWAVENELIDRYVRGRLTPAEKHLFEENYLASAVHRERVAFARDLVRAVDSDIERDESESGTAHSWWHSFSAGWRATRFRWALVAAVALFAAISAWLLLENIRLREQVNQMPYGTALEQRVQELERDLKAQREQSDELAAELAYLREEQASPIGPETPSNPNGPRSVISFSLSPLLMRDSGEPQQLKIPKEINAVLLRLQVREPNGRSFHAGLKSVEGTQIWSRSNIKARAKEKNGSIVSVSIPANKILPGEYILTLSAGDQASELEEINRYFFRVVKQ